MRNILLLGPGKESHEALKLLSSVGIEVEPLYVKKNDIWMEINYPLPTLFWQGKYAFQGIEKIEDLVKRRDKNDKS